MANPCTYHHRYSCEDERCKAAVGRKQDDEDQRRAAQQQQDMNTNLLLIEIATGII